MRENGFTLLEVILAIALSAIVIQGSMLLLQGMSRSHGTILKQGERLDILVRCLQQMTEDFTNAAPRQTRTGKLSVLDSKLMRGDERAISFISSIPDTVQGERILSDIRWYLHQGILYRLSGAPGAEPVRHIMLIGVEFFHLRFYQAGYWHPVILNISAPVEAVEITISVKESGTVQRLVLIGQGG